MYYVMVLLLMTVLPIISIALEIILCNPTDIIVIIIKWFVFWSVGVRFITASIKQILQPKYTSENILGINNQQSWILVRELGISNLSIGIIGIFSLLNPQWIIPAGLSGGIFLGLAGINHILQKHKNYLEKVATISNLFVSMVLFVFIVLLFLQ